METNSAFIAAKKILEHSTPGNYRNWQRRSLPGTPIEVRFLSAHLSSVHWHHARGALPFHPTEAQVELVCDRARAWYGSILCDEQALLNKMIVIVTDEMEWVPPVHFDVAGPYSIPMAIAADGQLDVLIFLPFTQKAFTKEQELEFLATIIAHELEHVFQLIVSVKRRQSVWPHKQIDPTRLIGWSLLGFIEMGAILAEFREYPENHHLVSYGADFLRRLHMGFLPAGAWYYFFPFLKHLWDRLGDKGDPREIWRNFDPEGEGPWFDYQHRLQAKGSSIAEELVAFYRSIFEPENREELLGLILDRYGSPTPSALIDASVELSLRWHPSGMHVIELLPNMPAGHLEVARVSLTCPYTVLGKSHHGKWVVLVDGARIPGTLELPENLQLVLLINLGFPRPSDAAEQFRLTDLDLQFRF